VYLTYFYRLGYLCRWVTFQAHSVDCWPSSSSCSRSRCNSCHVLSRWCGVMALVYCHTVQSCCQS